MEVDKGGSRTDKRKLTSKENGNLHNKTRIVENGQRKRAIIQVRLIKIAVTYFTESLGTDNASQSREVKPRLCVVVDN